MRFIKIITLIPCITFIESAQASSPSLKESTDLPIAKKSPPKTPPLSSLSDVFPMRTGFRTQEQGPPDLSKPTRMLKNPPEKKDDKITAAARHYNLDPVQLQKNYTKVVGWSHLSTLYDIRYQTGQTVADLFLISLPAILINEVFTKASFDFNGLPAAQENLIGTATRYTRLGIKIVGMDPNEIMNNLRLRMISA